MVRRWYGYRSPWREMERLRREMSELVSALPAGTGGLAPGYPAVNVWTNEDSAVVTAELPGLSASDIEISVEGDTVTLSGERAPERTAEGGAYHRRERKHGRFTRALKMPFPVEVGEVDAVFEKGVLNIALPRLEADRPRRIEVRAA